MKKFILFSFFTMYLFESKAQSIGDTFQCNYPDRDTANLEQLPWFDNNDYLINFLDSIGYPRNGNTNRIVDDNVRYWVPIKFWIYRNNAGSSGPNIAQLQTYIDNLNKSFNNENNAWIGFYMKCDVSYINNDNHLSVTDLEALSLVATNKDIGAVNIHIADELKDAFGVYYNTYFFGEGIFLSSETYTSSNTYGSTIAHEVGHFFNLDHTHQYANRGQCRKEAIDRTRKWPLVRFCPFTPPLSSKYISETNGDCLRDTPADPDLSDNNNCSYVTLGKTDPWGDHYETPPSGSLPPDTRNLMSYNRDRACRFIFSEL